MNIDSGLFFWATHTGLHF